MRRHDRVLLGCWMSWAPRGELGVSEMAPEVTSFRERDEPGLE